MAAAPTNIGPYRVVRELGRGGMGVVWEVRHPASPRALALKQVLGDAADGEALRRFTREAELLARLRHPGVVVVHAFGSTEVGPYLVTDLVVGRDLKELARGGPLAPRRAAELMAGVAAAVEAVHAHGLLHRDLKPGNVIVQESDGRPVLLDFGLARELDGSSLTQSGALVGTPGFMSPEQVDGRRDLDARSDVYGLGAVLFFLLAGRAPFEGSLVQIFARVLTAEPEWPRAAPADLVAIARHAMEKERDARYASAAALAGDLQRWLAGERPLAARRGRARRVAWVAAAVVTLAVVAAAAWLIRCGAAERDAPVVLPTEGPASAAVSASASRSGDTAQEVPAASRRSRLSALRSSRVGPDRLAAWRALVAEAARLPAEEREAQERDLVELRSEPLFVGRPPKPMSPRGSYAWVGFTRGAEADDRLGWAWQNVPAGGSLDLSGGGGPGEWAGPAGAGYGARGVLPGPGRAELLLLTDTVRLASLAQDARSPEVRWSVPDLTTPDADRLHAAAIDLKGRRVALGGERSTVWVLDARTGDELERLDSGIADDRIVESLAFSRAGDRLVVVRTERKEDGPRGRVDVWTLGERSSTPVWTPVEVTTPRPRSAAFDADGSLVVGFDGGHVWRYRQQQERVRELTLPRELRRSDELSDETGLGADLVQVRVDRAGHPVVVTGAGGEEAATSGHLVTRDLPGAPGTSFVGEAGPAFTSLDLSLDESLVATGDREGVVKLWAWRLP